jgi:hypothetical protein
MHRFAMGVASGKTLSDAYRAAYEADRMKPAVVRNEACKLMQRRDITVTVERLRAAQEASYQAATLSDRERVLARLRYLLDHAEGTPAEQVALRAADLLGKSVGLYKDVAIVEKPQRSAAELRSELEERLAMLVGQPTKEIH